MAGRLRRSNTLPLPTSDPTSTSLYASLISESPSNTLVRTATLYSKAYMSTPRFDSSHNFNHILSVTALSLEIFSNEQTRREQMGEPLLNRQVVVLGALLHDINDGKYGGHNFSLTPSGGLHSPAPGVGTFAEADTNGNAAAEDKADIFDLLVSWKCDEAFASRVSRLCSGVSYSGEMANPARVNELINKIPELAVVQDADRLDALGAVGIGRCFFFGGARDRTMGDCIGHFVDKLLKLERMMKTETGREMAKERTQRLREFMRWWKEETTVVVTAAQA